MAGYKMEEPEVDNIAINTNREVQKKFSEVKRVEINNDNFYLNITKKQEGELRKNEGEAEKKEGELRKNEGEAEKKEKVEKFKLGNDQKNYAEASAQRDSAYIENVENVFKKSSEIRKELIDFSNRTIELNKKISNPKDEQEYKKALEELIVLRKEEKEYIEKVFKKENLNGDQKELLNNRLKKIDQDITHYTKELLGTRNLREDFVRDNILENTIIQYREIKQKEEEDVLTRISDYYLTTLELRKEFQKINQEQINEEEKDKKKEKKFEEYYNTLTIGNKDHDETVKSFIKYNLTNKAYRGDTGKKMDIITKENKKENFEEKVNETIKEEKNFLNKTIAIKTIDLEKFA